MNARFATLSVALMLLLPFFAHAISSEEALAKAKPYLDYDLAPLPKPLFSISDYYWVYSPSIYSSKKIFVAVSDFTGEMVFEENALKAIGTAAFNYGIYSEFVKQNKYAFSDWEPTVRQTLTAVQRNEDTLAALESRIQQDYPTVSFLDLSSKSQTLYQKILELDAVVSDGIGLERQFEADFSDLSLNALIEYYKNAFETANEFIAAYDDYNNAITKKQTEIFKSDIPGQDNKNIIDSLEGLRLKIDLFETLRYQKPAQGIARLEGERDKWVEDSLNSLKYKQLYVEVLALYNSLKPSIETVYYSEANLRSCGLQTQAESVKSKWREIQTLMEKASADDLNRLKAKLPLLQSEYDSLKQQYDSCINPSKPYIPSNGGSDGGTNWIMPIAILLVLAAGGYLVWKYKQNQEETYE